MLAAGRGSRMRAAAGADLSPAQRAMAERGLKAMVPVGRPFLDYVLSGLADAGIRSVCLVVGPNHQEVRDYYAGSGRPTRVRLEFVEQAEPRGTADAVLAAETFAGRSSIVVVNADNLYPGAALEGLRALPRAGLVAWRRSALLAPGTIPEDRVNTFALLEVNAQGMLIRILEKPSPAEAATFGADPLVSMNAWLLPPTIFPACRAIVPSSRGELELQDAVRHSIEAFGERFQVVPAHGAVLDLSRQADIPFVAERLRALAARP